MFVSADAVDAYSIAVLAGAQYAHLLAHSLLAWPLIFFLFSLPAFNLLINLGFVSGAGPILTFSRIAPIASGVGWALTWLIGERLFMQSLSAAQNLLYFIYSIRTRLDWALTCDHKYNDESCSPFLGNLTGSQPEELTNHWPAQQFNRHFVRRVSLDSLNGSSLFHHAWYFGVPGEVFTLGLPAFSLTFSHFLIWVTLFLVVYRYGANPGYFLSRFCYFLPLGLLALLTIGLSIFGFSFSKTSESELLLPEVEKNPDFFAIAHGFFRTSIVLMDYSSAFTGIIIFASSRIRSAAMPMNAIALLTAQMFAPVLLYILRVGCNGHLADKQPMYQSFVANEATFSFDTAAVCFATSPGGPIWALLYYSANLLLTCIGPMVVLLLYIYNVFLEQFPFLEHFASQLLALICASFALFGLLLTMPMGTSFATLFSYVSQASLTQIYAFVIIMFVYGWYNLDADMRLMLSSTETYKSLFQFLIGPSSPLYTILLFTSVPAFLATKFVSVFDLFMTGMDVYKHIHYGTSSLTRSQFLNHFVGYLIMFGPILIITAFAIYAFYKAAFVYKMPWGSILDPTTDWHSNIALRQNAVPRPAPLSHRLYTAYTKIPYRTALFIIFVIEIVFGVILLLMFFSHAIYSQFSSRQDNASANNYRTVMFLTFATVHALALLEIRWALKKWDHSSRLNLCIAVSTMEMAFLNGYMWMFAMDHSWGLVPIPFLVVFVNTAVRGTMVAVLIAIRWNIAEQSHPTHIRDATEIYDATADLDNDLDREDNAPIIYEMHRDVFT